MKIDKYNGDVCFNEAEHVYWDNKNNDRFVSVTTMIHSFTNEFEKEFWSAYKALEKLLGTEAFKLEKKTLLTTHKVTLQYFIDNYDITKQDFNHTQQEILDKWQEENILSCERGTKIHSGLEQQYYGKDNVSVQKYGVGGAFTCKKDYFELDLKKGVYPELLLSRVSEDGKFKLAGQVDLVIKDNNDISIIDYKTNKKLEETSAYDTRLKRQIMMKYPLNNLMDCNMVHYTLQLSTYAWMLQMINPEFNIKKLLIEHHDHNGNVTTKEVGYLKEDVIRMCKFYKKQSFLKEKKEARKPIEF